MLGCDTGFKVGLLQAFDFSGMVYPFKAELCGAYKNEYMSNF